MTVSTARHRVRTIYIGREPRATFATPASRSRLDVPPPRLTGGRNAPVQPVTVATYSGGFDQKEGSENDSAYRVECVDTRYRPRYVRTKMLTDPPRAGRPTQFRLLGPLEVRTDLGEVAIAGTRSRCVLAALLLQANRVAPMDQLVDAAWGETRRLVPGFRYRTEYRVCAACYARLAWAPI